MTTNNNAAMEVYLRDIRRIPLLTPQEEIELSTKMSRKGDPAARALMINSNLRLVVTIAQDYANLGLPLLDAISEGNIGLMRAVDRFDPAKGGRLSTYAAWWIRHAIKRALSNQGKTIRLPVHLGDKIWKMHRVALQMGEELGRDPTDGELSEEIGIDRGKVSQLKTASIRPASLDAPIGDDDLAKFGESVADEEAQTPFELLRDKDLRAEVGDLLEELDDREKEIIYLRFGFDGGKGKTLEDVGHKLGISGERVRQLENAALSKLRRALGQKEVQMESERVNPPLPRKRVTRRWPVKIPPMTTSRITIMIAACSITLLGACGRNEKEAGTAGSPTPAATLAPPRSDWTPRPLIESNNYALPAPTQTPGQSSLETDETNQTDDLGEPDETMPSPTASLHPVDPATEEKIEMLKKRADEFLNIEPALEPTP